MIVIKKRIWDFPLGLFFLFLFLGCHDLEITGAWPPAPYNIVFSPSNKVKRGEPITIRFDMRDCKDSDFLNRFYINEDGKLFNEYGDEILEAVEVGIQIHPGSILDRYKGKEFKLTENRDSEKVVHSGIFIRKFHSVKRGEVMCVVPEDAVSGYIQMFPENRFNQGFSDEPLIIVDESGDEITK